MSRIEVGAVGWSAQLPVGWRATDLASPGYLEAPDGTAGAYFLNVVIRGEDLLASTGRQIRLARLLGRVTPPRFAHHPLVMKSPTQKLSKSDGDTGIRDLRAAGWTADAVLAKAKQLSGRL